MSDDERSHAAKPSLYCFITFLRLQERLRPFLDTPPAVQRELQYLRFFGNTTGLCCFEGFTLKRGGAGKPSARRDHSANGILNNHDIYKTNGGIKKNISI